MGEGLPFLRFDAPLRRRARQVGRLGAAIVDPGMYPEARVARAFWFDGVANFGDGLTPWLFRRAGIIPIHSTAAHADISGVGSILEMLPIDYAGQVWGSGSLRGEPLALENASVLAVRGRLTRELISTASNARLGDPGILVSRFQARPPSVWEVGVVPHHMHEDDRLWRRWKQENPERRVRIIDVRRQPGVVLSEIARCRHIISTSLHGLITADAYGIPAVWTRRDPDLWGGRFKFDDYESVVTPRRSRFRIIDDNATIDEVIRQTSRADAGVVTEVQDGLLRALDDAAFPSASPLRAVARLVPRGRVR